MVSLPSPAELKHLAAAKEERERNRRPALYKALANEILKFMEKQMTTYPERASWTTHWIHEEIEPASFDAYMEYLLKDTPWRATFDHLSEAVGGEYSWRLTIGARQ